MSLQESVDGLNKLQRQRVIQHFNWNNIYLCLTSLVTLFIVLVAVANNIQPQWLSPMLLSQIPIKHLLEQARSRRQEFRGLYAPLLQLINTHLPHLCLVDDWLRQEEVFTAPLSAASPLPNIKCSPLLLKEGTSNNYLEWFFFLFSFPFFIFIAELHFEHFETSLFGRSILNTRASVSSDFQTSRKGLQVSKAPLRAINELCLCDVWCFVVSWRNSQW